MMDKHEDKDKDENMGSKESRDEDPVEGQDENEYTPKTHKGKEMQNMFTSFCHLSKPNVIAISVYFGMSRLDKLSDFCEGHWKDTFIQWQIAKPVKMQHGV